MIFGYQKNKISTAGPSVERVKSKKKRKNPGEHARRGKLGVGVGAVLEI